MKTSALFGLTAAALLLPFMVHPQPSHGDNGISPGEDPFLEPGSWWNLYFAEGENPLQRGDTTIHAVKILKPAESRPSWIKIAFPKSREEHFSIFGPAARAHENEDVDIEDALAEWEKEVSEWRVIWINLQHVVHATQVGEE